MKASMRLHGAAHHSPDKRSARWAVWLPVVAAAAVLGWPAAASACSCQPVTPQEAKQDADAVFEGRVVAISAEQPAPGVGPGVNRVVMRVVRTWKGAERPQIEVRTAQNEAACGYPFEPDRSYLVYARHTPNEQLRTGLCSRTRPIAEAQQDIGVLGAGVTPVEVEERSEEDDMPQTTTPSPSAGGCRSCAATAGGRPTSSGAGLAVFGAALIIRRLRRERTSRG